MNNPPTDFSVGDLLLIKLNKFATINNTVASWTSTISDPVFTTVSLKISVIVPVDSMERAIQVPIASATSSGYIKINTYIGIININGFNLNLEKMTEDNIKITGKIESLDIVRIIVE